jgi:hypothetical protein
VHGWLSVLPWWLVVGLGIGVAFTAAAAGLFYLGDRLFPEPSADDAARTTADERRRAEIRAYLDAIGERYAEDHAVGDRTVAFYLPERDVAITFDARTYFRLDGTDTAAVLVEHEMPGAAVGARLPFETPDPTPDDGRTGPGPGDSRREPPGSGQPVAAAFAELGLPSDADEAAVKAAYRRQVKEVHPDQGGDPEAFQRVREAYTVAKEASE